MMSNYISLPGDYRIYALRGYLGAFHLLYHGKTKELILIDTGLRGELAQLTKILAGLGLRFTDIRAILLTHGHLDHTGNLAQLKKLTGAPLLAHSLEQPHLDGRYPYHGPSRLCGIMEAIGRITLRYQAVKIDRHLSQDEELAYWSGLKVLHLPGHTAGHCGYYSERFNLLFSGDLFASYHFSTHLPPAFLNSCPKQFTASLKKVVALSPRLIIPNHYDMLDGELHRHRFDALKKASS